MRLTILCAAMFLSGLLAGAARAQPVELTNDGFADGGSAAFQGGFVAGEIAAARFDPAAAGTGTYRVTEIRFLFGGGTAGVTQTVQVHVWEDEIGVDPGTERYTGAFELTAADDALASIVFDTAIVVPGKFRVGIELMHDGYPSVARDGDGITPDANYVRAMGAGWVEAGTLGITGDLIIRAVVDAEGASDGGVGTDGGMSADGGSMAGGDGGVVDGGGAGPVGCVADTDCMSGRVCGADGVCVAQSADDGGCACRASRAGAPVSPSAPVGVLASVLAVAVWSRRTRRGGRR